MKEKKQEVICDCKDKEGVEFWGGYDGVSMYHCKNCGACFDRWSGQRIIVIYNDSMSKYGQPMFLLEDGSMSRMGERWINPIHKKRKFKWINIYNYLTAHEKN